MLFHRTLMDNIRYGRSTATDKEVVEASKKAHIHAFIMELPDQYESYVGERGIKLSGGQRQRIGIARAIALKPKLIICDESVSALDVSIQAQILNLLSDLKEKYHFTFIFISHDISVIKYFTDRLIILKKGEIIELNETDFLFQHPENDYTKSLLKASDF